MILNDYACEKEVTFQASSHSVESNCGVNSVMTFNSNQHFGEVDIINGAGGKYSSRHKGGNKVPSSSLSMGHPSVATA